MSVTALVNDISGVGGGQQVMLDIARVLLADGFEPVVVSPPGPLAHAAREIGVRWAGLEFSNRRMLTPRTRVPRPSAFLERRREAERLERLLDELGARIVHTGALVPHITSMFLRSPAKRVWHVNQLHPSALFFGRLPDRIIAVSEAAARPARRRKQADERLAVVPNAVDLERFRPRSAAERAVIRERLGLPLDRLVVLNVARLEPSKGVHLLVDAVARCRTRPLLVVVGGAPGGVTTPYAGALGERASAAGCEAVFLGERHDVPDLMAAADLFALASTWEAFGLVLAEAAASGVAAVAGPSGGCREVVGDGVTGALADPRDTTAFASAIDALLHDPTTRAKLGREARRLAEQRFNHEAFAEALLPHYRALSR